MKVKYKGLNPEAEYLCVLLKRKEDGVTVTGVTLRTVDRVRGRVYDAAIWDDAWLIAARSGCASVSAQMIAHAEATVREGLGGVLPLSVEDVVALSLAAARIAAVTQQGTPMLEMKLK